MNNEARSALRNAQGNLSAAGVAHAHARATADRARENLAGVIVEGERLDASERRSAEALAENMKASLVSGAALSVTASDRDVSKSAAVRAALDVRRAAAERVVSDFASAEREAAEAFSSAQAAVAAAVKAVIRAEAEALAAKWAQVDAEARALRARLGAPYGVLTNVGALDAAVLQAINLNSDDRSDLQVNGAVESAWMTLAAELQSNSEAMIDFSPVDCAREEAKAARERVYASDEEIARQLAQFRSRPASPEPADDWKDYDVREVIA
jgi:trimeric autotransporter adhesin